jgi:hypothetical protein
MELAEIGLLHNCIVLFRNGGLIIEGPAGPNGKIVIDTLFSFAVDLLLDCGMIKDLEDLDPPAFTEVADDGGMSPRGTSPDGGMSPPGTSPHGDGGTPPRGAGGMLRPRDSGLVVQPALYPPTSMSAKALVEETRFSSVVWVFHDLVLHHSVRNDGWRWVALDVKSWTGGGKTLSGDGHFTLMYLPPAVHHENVIKAMQFQLDGMLRKGHVFEGRFGGDVSSWGDYYACVSVRVDTKLHNSLHNIAQAGVYLGGGVRFKKPDFFHLSVRSTGSPPEEHMMTTNMVLALEDM